MWKRVDSADHLIPCIGNLFDLSLVAIQSCNTRFEQIQRLFCDGRCNFELWSERERYLTRQSLSIFPYYTNKMTFNSDEFDCTLSVQMTDILWGFEPRGPETGTLPLDHLVVYWCSCSQS
ncbi:hypothetical protein AVEN_175983-1 [Araneus ventricosus]|uniref:Uncharacterized protein n=1 Tax=Araneus ventricosus TaxID=182803 RepID=A0A4Y2END7_ARAVE|nr:hypothetical protein AVEN_175983-1 [Araneus ventricosus]